MSSYGRPEIRVPKNVFRGTDTRATVKTVISGVVPTSRYRKPSTGLPDVAEIQAARTADENQSPAESEPAKRHLEARVAVAVHRHRAADPKEQSVPDSSPGSLQGGMPERIRTSDLLLRRQTLYPG